MTTASEMQAKVDKAVTNFDRIDDFVNADETTDVTLDGGAVVPSMQKIAGGSFRRVSAPTSASAAGSIGDMAVSTTFAYFYTGNGVSHSWHRVALSSW